MNEAGSPDVSVVIPTRNRRAMLEQTLGSVLGQRDVTVQAIVVDEASSDDTQAWLASLDDPRVTVVRHDQPVRLPGARNAGVRHARADLLAFVDDDDLWGRDKLSRQLEALRRADASWAYVGAVHVGEDLEPVAVQRAPDPSQVASILRRYNVVPGGGSGVLVTRRALEAAGPFDESLSAAEDWECWLRLAAAGRAAAVDAPLLAYRRLPHSMSHEIDRMITALRRVADLHPDEIERDPRLGVPVGTLSGLARLAREAGDVRTAAKLLWMDRHRRSTLVRAPLYLAVPAVVMRKSFLLRREQLRWSQPLLDELAPLRAAAS